MKRLRELETRSPLIDQAKKLLDSVDALPESHERMWRIRRELDRPRGALAFMRRLPAVAIAGWVVLFGVSAFAAVKLWPGVHPSSRQRLQQPTAASPQPRVRALPGRERSEVAASQIVLPDTVPVTAQPAAGAHRNARPRRALHQPATLPASDTASSAAATVPSSALEPPQPRKRARATPLALPRPSASDQAPPAQAADPQPEAPPRGSELVHRAVEALRREHDPALAARLLDQHRARNPAGPLAEEALSLRIEAALLLGDVRARSWAREYLTRYPGGRYSEVAKRAAQDLRQ
jgi:hypothetical protein